MIFGVFLDEFEKQDNKWKIKVLYKFTEVANCTDIMQENISVFMKYKLKYKGQNVCSSIANVLCTYKEKRQRVREKERERGKDEEKYRDKDREPRQKQNK